jgi:hypothetical protein
LGGGLQDPPAIFAFDLSRQTFDGDKEDSLEGGSPFLFGEGDQFSGGRMMLGWGWYGVWWGWVGCGDGWG